MAFDWKTQVLRNGTWLTFPAMIWNIVFIGHLPPLFSPETFWKDISAVVRYGENILRMLIFTMAAFLIVRPPRAGRRGSVWYLAGTLAYFASWLPLLFAPASAWSKSLPGLMAPAYTPLIWLVGIGLLGREFYFSRPYRPVYFIGPAVVFTIFHCAHVAIAGLRSS